MNKYIKFSLCGALAVLMGFSLSCTEEEPINLPPTFALRGVTDIMRTTATFTDSISGDLSSIKTYGYEYSTSENFPNDKTWKYEVNGTPTSNVTATITDLEANERYYYRLFATTGLSKVYSTSEYFQTLASSAPLLSALEVDSIGENTARFRCTVQDIGDEYLIEYGVGYKKISDQAYIPVPSDSIVAGTDNTFFVEIMGLDAGTKYLFRPYAKNSADASGETGAREGYGAIVEEKTEDQKSAVVTTSEIV